MFLLRLVKKLRERKVDFAVAGGFAVSLHGAVRGTLDIDIVILWSEDQLQLAEAALKSLGLQSRLPLSAKEVFAFRDEYIRNRNLIAWSFVNSDNPIEIVDLLINADLSSLGTKNITVQGTTVPIVALEDLITMKRLAGREQDLADITALEKLR